MQHGIQRDYRYMPMPLIIRTLLECQLGEIFQRTTHGHNKILITHKQAQTFTFPLMPDLHSIDNTFISWARPMKQQRFTTRSLLPGEQLTINQPFYIFHSAYVFLICATITIQYCEFREV